MDSKITYLTDYAVSNYLIEKVYLEFELEEEYALVISTAIFYKNPESEANNTLSLDGEEIDLVEILLDGKKLSESEYLIKGNKLIIANTPEKFELKITTKCEPQNNTQLMGLYQSNGIFCTQCESEGFRRITYFLDRPDVLTFFTVKITGDKNAYPLLLSNGNIIESGEAGEEKHYVIWQDPFAKPCYLFALVAGDLEYLEDTFTTMSGKKALIRVFSEKHNISKIPFSIECIKKSMTWDEERFGREYDLDMFMVVAVDDFNSGAMENKGLNIFNSSCIFATEATATDRDFIRVEKVIGHEYFHNWTGDRVTCRDWFQLSLKEGLTVYRDHEFTSDLRDRGVARVEGVKLLKSFQFKEDSSPMAHPIRPEAFEEISNFYTATVYEKGSEIIRIYEQILGREGFRAGMDLYFERHDGQAVTTEDFLAAMRDANIGLLEKDGVDLNQMQNWYNQAGTPTVYVVTTYNSETQKLTINFRQSCPDTPETPAGEKKPFLIPVHYSVFEKEGAEEIANKIQVLSEETLTLVIENVKSEPVCSFLKGLSAPVKLDYEYTTQELDFLVKHDDDEYIQFESFQNLARSIIINKYHASLATGEGVDLEKLAQDEKSFLDIVSYVLESEKYSDSLKGEMLELPGEQDIVETIGENIHHDVIHKQREGLKHIIAKKLTETFQNMYADFAQFSDEKNGEYDLSNEAIGRRKLQNLVLFYLTVGTQESTTAYKQFSTASNMTLEMGALNSLVEVDNEFRKKALAEFYTKWKGDATVIDKWFAIQARGGGDNIFSVLETLSTDTLFSIKNPNKVRSVYSVFANMNLASFNNVSGEGYKLIADKVIKLDVLNPMIASRLAKSLINYKVLEPVRQGLLKKELQRIAAQENLSPDLGEVVRKSLG